MPMERIGAWLRQIMVVVLIAGFLDLLLPNNQLKGVTRLIMGLLVLIILIQPLTDIFQLPLEPAWSLPDRTDAPLSAYWDAADLVEQGLILRRRWETVYRQESHAELTQEIKIILARHGIGRLAELNLVIADGRLGEARIRLSPGTSLNIEPELCQKISGEIIRKVSRLTGLNEKQIEVIWDESQ